MRPDPRPEWMERALCPQVDLEIFYPEKGEHAKALAAKRVCRMCPVREECLVHALGQDEQYGVWGGMTARERRRLSLARAAA